uniref:Ketimine reductase mu-crystallin n=1 Tax=Zeugodacus cucurbitae TaxID=28588 RepID=A0A0A1WY32_ZEUCU
MSTPINQITAEQVREVLNWGMVCEAVEEAMKSVANSQPAQSSDHDKPHTSQPARSITTCGDKSKILFSMPAYVGNFKLTSSSANQDSNTAIYSTIACKLVTSFSKNPERENPLPRIMANILIFNTETGKLDCVMDGTDITTWRTAAASLVATKYLYFSRYPEGVARPVKVAIIGTGVQGESHALGMCNYFTVSDIYLWNRTHAKAESLAKKLQSEIPNVSVHACTTASEAVADADIVCVGTYSSTPLVTRKMLKKRHVHINSKLRRNANKNSAYKQMYHSNKASASKLVYAHALRHKNIKHI